LILNIASGVYVRYWRTKVKSSEPLAVDFGLSVSIRQPAAGLCPLASQLQSRSGVGPVCVTNLAHLRLLPVPAESVMTLTRCFHGEQRIVGKRACRFSPAEVFGPRGGWSAVLGVLRAVDCPRRISLLRLAGRGGYGPLRLGQSLCIAHVAGWITRALQLRPKHTAASLRPADGHRSGGHGSLSRLERQLLHLCRGALHAPLALLAALQVRGFLGEAGGFLDGIGLGSSKRAPDSTTLRSSQTVSPPGAPGPQTLVEYLYLWENVGDQSGSFEISFTKAAHGSLSGFAIDSSIAAEAVPEPTTAALAAAGALAVAGSAARRLLRRRRRHAVAEASPSSSCSSSSPSSACSSGSCCRRSGRSGRPPAARSA